MKHWNFFFAGAALSLTIAFSTAAYGIGPYTGDGSSVITDTATGLEWQEVDDGTRRNWKDSLAYCESLSLQGNDDWRLPNISELLSIVDRSRSFPAIDPVFSAPSDQYWSATTYVYSPDYAWNVYSDFGDDHYYGKSSTWGVRCVRAGL